MLPQIIMIVLLSMDITLGLAFHGKPRPNYNGWTSLISAIIMVALLYWGGFFDVLFK